MPRRLCGDWSPGLVLLHNISDALTCASYFAIPAILIYFLRRRRDIPFRPIFWLFGAFIFACGLTHLFEIVVFYTPVYRLIGVLKLATGLVSATTAAALIRSIPGALALRGMRTLERELEVRRLADEVTRARNRQLEALIDLNRCALMAGSRAALAGEVVAIAAQGLGADLCGILEPVPGRAEMQLLAGVGWRAGLVGTARVAADFRQLVDFVAREAGATADQKTDADGRFIYALLDRDRVAIGGVEAEVHGSDQSNGILVDTPHRPKALVLVAHALEHTFGEDDVWFLRSVAAVIESNLGRIEAERTLKAQATTDALTGLFNSRHLREESSAVEGRAARTGQVLSAVMLDVDHFKDYNDAFGHPAGDEVLRMVGAILRREARAGDLAARYGGEEFAFLLPGADAAEAMAFADRLRLAIEAHPWPLRPVTVSLGVATGRPPFPGVTALLSQADRALYLAKRAGRNCVTHSGAGPAEEDAVARQCGRDGAISAEPKGEALTVLHIDDDPGYRRALERHLVRAGYIVRGASSGAEGVRLAAYGPDLILLDISIQDVDGRDICRRLKADPATTAIPILGLSGALHSGPDRVLALVSGASAAVCKSSDPSEVLAIASALVRASRSERNLIRVQQEMMARLREQAGAMERVCDATIEGWARALELRDHETEGHSRRVTELATRVARRMGVDEAELLHMRRGSLLHDIGKVGVPDAILNKRGPLNEEEQGVMRRHPELARRMLEPIEFLRPALAIPYSHHERWDGTGYPEGLRAEEIPQTARIFAAADIYDALTHDRPYREAWPVGRVKEYIRSISGSHLDPAVTDAILTVV